MKYVKDILTALIAVVGVVGAAAQTEVVTTESRGKTVFFPVRDTGPGTEVKTDPVVKEKLYVDSIGFGSDEPNWGGPFVIGHCGGRAVSVGYDYNYLMHMVYVDGEPILYDGSLAVEADSAANRAVFRRCEKSINIDFNKGDALDRLARFVAPEKGLKRERYSYVFGGKDNNFVNRTTIVAELPTAPAAKRRVLEAMTISHPKGGMVFTEDISVDIDKAYSYEDTVFVAEPQPVINSLYDYVCAHAQFDRLNSENYNVPLPADSMVAPMSGFVRLVEYVPVMMTDKMLTLYAVENKTYPAGGCRGSQESYITYVTRGDKKVRLTAEDIFLPEKMNVVKQVFINRLSMELDDTTEPNAYEDVWPDVALLPNGVMFVYNLSLLSDFGEDGLSTLFVPYKALNGCFRYGVLPIRGK